jgi:hypothetical protein
MDGAACWAMMSVQMDELVICLMRQRRTLADYVDVDLSFEEPAVATFGRVGRGEPAPQLGRSCNPS